MKEPTVYVCENPACSLGTPGSPGRFTGGLSETQALILTGNPAAEHGEGVCPNCGQRGKETKETQPEHVGDDPYAEIHAAVASRVADPEDPLTAGQAQAAVLAGVTETSAIASRESEKVTENG